MTFYWAALRCDSNPHVRFPRQLHHTFRKLVRKYSEQKLPITSSVSLWDSKNKCWEKTVKLLTWSKVRIWAGFANPKCQSIHWFFGFFWPWRSALVVMNEMKNEMLLSLNEKTNVSYTILLQWVTIERQKNWELPRFSRLGVTITGADIKFSLEKVVAVTKIRGLHLGHQRQLRGNLFGMQLHCALLSVSPEFCFVLFSLKSALYWILHNVSGGRAEMHSILLPIWVQADIGCVIRMQ